MLAVAVTIVLVRNLFAAVALGGAYSFLMALTLLVLDAVDVSMTEASVGAGISTVLLLGALYLTKESETAATRPSWGPLAVTCAIGAALIYGIWSLPDFGSADNVINQHVVPRYIEGTMPETGVPNIVTSVLASYRGYDTLGETTVIFTAGIGVLLLLKRRQRQGGDK